MWTTVFTVKHDLYKESLSKGASKLSGELKRRYLILFKTEQKTDKMNASNPRNKWENRAASLKKKINYAKYFLIFYAKENYTFDTIFTVVKFYYFSRLYV